MTQLFRNAGDEAIAFRDDDPSGKHIVEPGRTFTVAGEQHIAHVLTLPGVVTADTPEPLPAEATVTELRDRADELGVRVPRRARKADVADAIAEVTGAPATVEPEAEPQP